MRAPLLSQVLLSILVVLGFADLALVLTAVALPGLRGGEDQEAAMIAALLFDRSSTVALFGTGAAYAFFTWWLSHRVAQLGRLRIAGQKYSPGWAVTGLLLPGATGFLPLKIVQELWRTSQTPVDFTNTRSWQLAAVDKLVPRWWAAALLAGVFWALWLFDLRIIQPELMIASELLHQHLLITGIMGASQLAAVWLTVLLVRALDRRQLHRFREVQAHYVMTAPGSAAAPPVGVAARAPLSVAHSLKALGMGVAFQVFFLLVGVLLSLPLWCYFISTQVILLAVAVTLARSERVPLHRLTGLRQPKRHELAGGVMIGIGAFGMAALLLFPKLEKMALERQNNLVEMLQAVPGWLVVLVAICVAPVVEEMLFRGVMFKALESSLSPLVVVVLTAGLFALIHGNVPQMIATFILGLHCGVARMLSGSVMPAIFVHFLNNVGALEVLPQVDVSAVERPLTFSLPFLLLLVFGYRQVSDRQALEELRHSAPIGTLLTWAERGAARSRPGLRKLWIFLQEQLFGGPAAHGLAIALASLFALHFLIKTFSVWRSTGSTTLLTAGFFAYWAWGMWCQRRYQTGIFLMIYAAFQFFLGLLLQAQGGSGWLLLWTLITLIVFSSGTLAVFRGSHVWELLPASRSAAAAMDNGQPPAVPGGLPGPENLRREKENRGPGVSSGFTEQPLPPR